MQRRHPIIGITTYEKTVSVDPHVDMVGIAANYKDAILAAGGIPLLLPLGLPAAAVRTVLQQLDGVVLPGGGDIDPARYNGHIRHPNVRGIDARRDEMEIVVAREALALDLPLLAICRGHQLLNVAVGGTLWQDVASQKPDAINHDYYGTGIARDLRPHTVDIRPNSRLAQLIGRTRTLVNSIHHQGVKELGDGVVATATAPDGLIEATELPAHRFAVSVQWHPENLIHVDPAMLDLFRGFVDAARAQPPGHANGRTTTVRSRPATGEPSA